MQYAHIVLRRTVTFPASPLRNFRDRAHCIVMRVMRFTHMFVEQ